MAEFHIHIDAQVLSSQFEQYLTQELGFWRSDFLGHSELEGDDGYEPLNHLTQKPKSSLQFRALFDKVLQHVNTYSNSMKGYIEGEFIPLDMEIEERPFDPSITPPFRLQMDFLPPGSFRESEIHITLSKDRSDQRLRQILKEMGFFSGYLFKSYGIAQVLTVQGSRKNIEAITSPLIEYLQKAGGAVACSIKEERVADWWMSQPDLRLPPVIDLIEWSV